MTPLYDPKQAKKNAQARIKEIRKHLADATKALNAADPINARLAAIRLEVWATALKEVTEWEVKNYITDRSRS